ncbi:MAG: diguanylate cyclase domain-containing protein [Nevskiaceae bacterium]
MTLRRRLALSVQVILGLLALNLGLHFWATAQRTESQEIARLAANHQQVTLRLRQEVINLRRMIELTMQTADGATPLPQGSLDSFDEGVRTVEGSTAALLENVEPEAEPHVREFARVTGELFASWRLLLASIGVDAVAAVTEHVRTEPLARRLLDDLLPRLELIEQRIAHEAYLHSSRVARLTNRLTVGIFLVSGVLAAIMLFHTSRYLTRGLSALNEGARLLGGGARSHRIALVGEDELAALARNFNDMADKLEDKTRELDLFFNLIDQTDDMLVILDPRDGRLLQVNTAACAAISRSKEELIGVDVRPRLGSPNPERDWNRFMRALAERRSARVHWRLRRADGSALPLEISARRVVVAGRDYVVAVARDVTQTKQLEEQLRSLSRVDVLTDVPNRRAFNERLALEWRRAVRRGQPISLLLIDVDCFKAYNDSLGHPAGDACLKTLARAFCASMRRDIDALARYGGEEFAALLTETSSEYAHTVAERLRESVEALRIPHPDSPVGGWVTVSIGHSTLRPARGDRSEQLVQDADRALYEAKRLGRNRVAAADQLPSAGAA